ncbi:MAG: hypothetical protein ACJ76H_09715 [Bacteriovoracaceae bacterium]
MNLLFVFIVAAMTGILVLCSMRLQRSFKFLEKRTHLFLCVKETEGEMKRYLTFMGRTNWALKNLQKARLVALFIPGLQGAALEGEEIKRLLISLQNLALVPYLKKVAALSGRGCPLDPRMLQTPFQLAGMGYRRAIDGTAQLRNEKWTYQYIDFPYALAVDWDASGFESIRPSFTRNSRENVARLSSILSSY